MKAPWLKKSREAPHPSPSVNRALGAPPLVLLQILILSFCGYRLTRPNPLPLAIVFPLAGVLVCMQSFSVAWMMTDFVREWLAR